MIQYQKDEKLLNLLEDKRVVIVGPSPHLMEKGIGKIIDSYDLVCRINEVHPTNYEKDYGNRTDIIFHNCGTKFINMFGERLCTKAYISKYIKYVICPCVKAVGPDDWQRWPSDFISPVVKNFNEINVFNLPFHWIGMQNYKMIYDEVGSEPNAGQTAITMLMNHNIKELLIVGFSFYAQGNEPRLSHRPGHTNKGLENELIGEPGHKQEPQISYFRNILKCYGHQIQIDSYLNSILDYNHTNVLDI